MHHPHHALVDGLPPLVVGEVLESADRTRSRRVDEHVQLTVPPLGQLIEYPLDRIVIGGVGHQPERIRATQCGQVLGRLVEHGLGSADDGHARAVLGQAARGREAHAASAADDYRRGVRETEVHGARSQVPVQLGARFSANAIAPSLASFDVKIGMMCSSCFFHISSSVQPADFVMTSLVVATAKGPLAVMRSASSIAPASASPGSVTALTKPHSRALLGGETLTGQREFERLLVRDSARQPQQAAARRHQTALDFGDTEFRGARRHDEVGGEHHFGAARQGIPLDGGDQRLPRRPFGEPDTAARNRDHLTGRERLQVHARTEVATCAGDDRH